MWGGTGSYPRDAAALTGYGLPRGSSGQRGGASTGVGRADTGYVARPLRVRPAASQSARRTLAHLQRRQEED